MDGARCANALALSIAIVMLAAGCTSPAQRSPDAAGITSPLPARPSAGSGPRFAADGPNADEYGARENYPVKAIYRVPFFVGVFSHYDEILESRVIRRAAMPSPLNRALPEPPVRYEYQGRAHTIDEYLAGNPATGLLIARGDAVLVERYQYARNERHRFASFSMAKTVTALLIGIALEERRIRSVDDLAGVYVPALADTEYGRTSIRHLLEMSSGVRFTETYSGQDDAARLVAETFLQIGAGGVESVKPFNERLRRAGTTFAYSSAETQVLGLVLRQAVGHPVAEYLQEKIWQPMGAESDATWLIDYSGQEATYCCLNAVLHDYARLALLLAHDGRLGERQIIPKAWLLAATTVPADNWHLKPYAATSYFGYGYQTWIFPGKRRMFALRGLHGQNIFVDPSARLVLVQTAVYKEPVPSNAELLALWEGLVKAFGD